MIVTVKRLTAHLYFPSTTRHKLKCRAPPSSFRPSVSAECILQLTSYAGALIVECVQRVPDLKHSFKARDSEGKQTHSFSVQSAEWSLSRRTAYSKELQGKTVGHKMITSAF